MMLQTANLLTLSAVHVCTRTHECTIILLMLLLCRMPAMYKQYVNITQILCISYLISCGIIQDTSTSTAVSAETCWVLE